MKQDAPAAVPFEIVPPETTPEFMWPAYFSCLRVSLGDGSHQLALFKIDTGISPPNLSPLDRLIDNATGFDPYDNFLRTFVPWFNKNVWGNASKLENPEEE